MHEPIKETQMQAQGSNAASDAEAGRGGIPAAQPGSWQPYENQWTETPFAIMKAFPRQWYRWRWAATYPLQWRLLWGHFTLGELVFVAAALGAAAGAMAGTWEDDKSSGSLAAIPMFMTFVLVSRNSIWVFLFGLPFERAVFWHQLSAYLSVIMGLYHGLVSWHFSTKGDGTHTVGDWTLSTNSEVFITGWGLQGAMTLMVASSGLYCLRRWSFRLWYLLHILLAIATIYFAFDHSATIIVVGLAAWGIDVAVRFALMAGYMYPHQVELVALPGDVVRIAWPKERFNYMGGQYCFICIPALSWFEWHPFSISSHPDQSQVYLHVRVLGKWTLALHQLASKAGPEGQPLMTKAFIEGPYGSPAADICGDRHDMFLLISGGIGITPMQSILNELLSQVARGRKIKHIWFVWSVRDKHMLTTVLDHNTLYADHALPKDLPLSFSPNLVSPALSFASRGGWTEGQQRHEEKQLKAEEDDFLRAEFYLTKARDASEFEAGNIDPKQQKCLRFGRPDLPKIFEEMARMAELKQPEAPRVAVMVCGPGSIMEDVTRLSTQARPSKVAFELHHEVFNL